MKFSVNLGKIWKNSKKFELKLKLEFEFRQDLE
jgi:hypothetical protein